MAFYRSYRSTAVAVKKPRDAVQNPAGCGALPRGQLLARVGVIPGHGMVLHAFLGYTAYHMFPVLLGVHLPSLPAWVGGVTCLIDRTIILTRY